MKTEYEIVWIDDDLDTVEEDRDAVTKFLEEHGIVAKIQAIESIGDGGIHNQISEIVKNPNLDLIVVDFLMDGMNGTELIELIRNSDHVFLPVVFYSSAGVTKLATEASEAQLDGVYLAPRDGVRNKIELVITSLIRKEQTPKRTRGLLMEGVSEIDATLGQVLEIIWKKLEQEQREQLIRYFKKKVNDRAKSSKKAHDNFPAKENEFWEHASNSFVSVHYDTVTRWKVIKKGLDLTNADDTLRGVFDELYESQTFDPLIRLRNNYAHKTRTELEQTHNEKLCVHIRNELRRQIQNIASIQDNL